MRRIASGLSGRHARGGEYPGGGEHQPSVSHPTDLESRQEPQDRLRQSGVAGLDSQRPQRALPRLRDHTDVVEVQPYAGRGVNRLVDALLDAESHRIPPDSLLDGQSFGRVQHPEAYVLRQTSIGLHVDTDGGDALGGSDDGPRQLRAVGDRPDDPGGPEGLSLPSDVNGNRWEAQLTQGDSGGGAPPGELLPSLGNRPFDEGGFRPHEGWDGGETVYGSVTSPRWEETGKGRGGAG